MATAELDGVGAAPGSVCASGATEVSKSLISLFSPNFEPAMSLGSDGVPISPVSLIAAP